MSIIIKSGASSDLQTVDSNKSAYVRPKDASGNDITKTQRQEIPATQGASLMAVKNDSISVMQRGDRKGNAIIGNYLPELFDAFEGSTINIQKWSPTASSFTSAQSTAVGLNLTSGVSTASGAYAYLISNRYFYKIPRVPMQIKTRYRHSMVANSFGDFGFGVPSTSTVIVPNGVMFRITSSGTIQGVITNGSSEIEIGNIVSRTAGNGNTVGGNLNMSNSYYTGNYFVYDIIIDDDNAIFTVQDTETGEIIGDLSLAVPNTVYKAWAATALPVYIRTVNSAVPASSPISIFSDIQVLSTDWSLGASKSDIAGSLNLSAGRHPFSGAQNENHTNSAAPTSATLSNTAAGYTTLGGKYQFAAVAGAETDYCLFGFQVPPNSRFECTGISINLFNSVVAVATTATVFEWAMGFNQSAVSLATANIIRRQIGTQSLIVATPVGGAATPLNVDFEVPEVTESGRYITVILKMPIGTATATEIFRGQIMIKGRFI